MVCGGDNCFCVGEAAQLPLGDDNAAGGTFNKCPMYAFPWVSRATVRVMVGTLPGCGRRHRSAGGEQWPQRLSSVRGSVGNID